MPTYEYACRNCETHLEVVQRFDDEPLSECPSCGGRLRKVFGSIGISFKGSGFYKTDSRAKAKAGAGSSPKPSAGEASGDSTSGDGASKTGDAAASTGKDGASSTTKESKGSKSSNGATTPTTTTPSAKSA